MHKAIFIIWMILLCNIATAQTHGGVEQYYYAGTKGISTIVPRAYFQDKNNWYGEIRYNYDELETFSFNVGKTFSKENTVSYKITPIAGAVVGKLNGISIGLNGECDYKKLFFSAESQYTFSSQTKNADFFFNWSELGYQVTDNTYGGLALQLTHLYKTNNKLEPGVMMGFVFNKWTFPVYIFNPGGKDRYIVLGINIEWSKTKNTDNKKTLL